MRLVVFAPGLRKSAIGRVALLAEQELRSLGHTITLVRSEAEYLLDAESHPFGCDVLAWNAGAPVEQAIRDADAIIYHIGDNYEFHRGAVEWLPAVPGIVCLHDFFLGHLFWAWATGRRGRATEVLGRWYGPDIARAYFAYGNNREFIARTHRDAPLTEWICEMATGVITHSNWGCDRVLRACAGPVRAVPLAYVAPAAGSAPEAAAEGTLRLITIGNVNPNKRVVSVITAIAADPILRGHIDYRIVGQVSEETSAVLTQLGQQTGARLALLGEVADDVLADEMAAADAVMCLRWPSLEGASASAIEAMMAGKPVIVTDTGFYAELPDQCVLKVDPLDEIGGIQRALSRLLDDRAAGRAMGNRAAAWAETIFSPANYARQTLAMVEDCAAAAAVLAGVNRFCGIAAEWSRSESLLPALDHIAASLSVFEKRPPPRRNIRAEDRPLAFLHIEKTAGTELSAYLRAHFIESEICEDYFGGPAESYFLRTHGRYFHGHFFYADLKRSGFDGDVITMLRSPIDRVFSHYSSLHDPSKLTDEWLCAADPEDIRVVRSVHDMTFDEFVRSDIPGIAARTDNLMSRRLSRNPRAHRPDLRGALSVLEREMFWFGIVEKFKESIQLLQDRVDGLSPYAEVRHNASQSYAFDLSSRGREILIERNAYDQELYDFATELFEKRWAGRINSAWYAPGSTVDGVGVS